MARYALIKDGAILEFRSFAVRPGDLPAKSRKWLPCLPVAPPSHDPLTEALGGPTYTVNESDVTEAWSVRSLTAQEITDSKAAAINAINAINGSRQAVLRAFYNVDKRLRVLEGGNAISFAQFKAGLPSVLP